MSRVDQDSGFALYLHWPFCRSKCPYCDFNSHVRERIDQARWRQALLAELDHYAALTPGRRVTSIFFGGGTPSLMEPATAGALIEQAARRWTMDGDVEITLEANPASVGAWRRGDFPLPEEGVAARLFEITQARLAAAGLPAYEISNHARPGAECRHNLVYWQGGDYIGIGPGAHGRVTLAGQRYAT